MKIILIIIVCLLSVCGAVSTIEYGEAEAQIIDIGDKKQRWEKRSWIWLSLSAVGWLAWVGFFYPNTDLLNVFFICVISHLFLGIGLFYLSLKHPSKPKARKNQS